MLDIRWGAAAAACALCFLCGTYALAGAPQLRTQAPGWYRMMLGDFEVTALNDGTFPMDLAKLLTNITPKQLDEDLSRSFLTNPVEASVNGFLINTGTKLVLIDTGAGNFLRTDGRQAHGESRGFGLSAGAGGRDLHHAHASGSHRRA